jgi:hypothetical protein
MTGTPPTGTPPSPDGAPLVGNTLRYASDRFGFVREARRECGDVFTVELLGPGTVCYLTHRSNFQ